MDMGFPRKSRIRLQIRMFFYCLRFCFEFYALFLDRQSHAKGAHPYPPTSKEDSLNVSAWCWVDGILSLELISAGLSRFAGKIPFR